MLSNFQLGNQALLQSFLVGQPELRALMQSPQMQQLCQRVIASYHLGPMDRDETQAYVEHRLRHVAGGRSAFEPGAFDVPSFSPHSAPINTLCNRLCWRPFRKARRNCCRRRGDRRRDQVEMTGGSRNAQGLTVERAANRGWR
jgi:hypothetical protein